MALNLLIVDPDEEWLMAAKGFFENILYNVKIVNNGKNAQIALSNEKFFAVILNIHTKNHSGPQVLKFIKTRHANQKVICITDVDDSEEADEDALTPSVIKKMGATETIVKPFEFPDLKQLLEGHQSVGEMVSNIPRRKELGPEEEMDLEDSKFTKVKISEFYTSQPVLFDLFVQLRSGRYVKILHAGDKLDEERINKYKNEKKVEYFYFKREDLYKYVKFNNYFAKKVIGSDKVAGEKKMKLLQNVSEKFLEQSFQEGLKPQILDQGKEIAENVFNLVQEQDDLYKILRSYQDFDPNAFTHSYLVSIFSTSIIKQFEWQSKTTIECTALACLFHDIGKMALPEELLHMNSDDMSEEQLEVYKTHVEKGYELLDGNPMLNNSVKQIVLQHHEYFDGTGFPYGKKGSKILTLANIVCLADDFAHIIQDEELKPIDALKELLTRRDQLTRYNSRVVENLIKVFADPAKIAKNYVLPSNSKVVNKKAS
jgi:response regulator RpfG family c-di-GMP phosphodiesterase